MGIGQPSSVLSVSLAYYKPGNAVPDLGRAEGKWKMGKTALFTLCCIGFRTHTHICIKSTLTHCLHAMGVKHSPSALMIDIEVKMKIIIKIVLNSVSSKV